MKNLNESQSSRSTILWLGAAVLVAIAARLLPHPPNFTPLAALGLFAGSVSSRPKWATIGILTAMFVSDCFLGFHPMMPIIYACLIVNIAIGSWFVRGGGDRFSFTLGSTGRIVAGSLMGSVLFFVVTNFAHFLAFYPGTMTGLVGCYTAAIPFFQYTLAGDLVYSGVLFGSLAFSMVRSRSAVIGMESA
jgi:hypothetical protein